MFSNWPHREMAPDDQIMGCRWLKSVFYPFPLGFGCLLWFRLYKVIGFNVLVNCKSNSWFATTWQLRRPFWGQYNRIFSKRIYMKMEQGWRSGESARLTSMWPGFKSRLRLHMWVEFVVGSLLCSERFFSGYSGFPLSSKTNISKFQFDQESGRRRTTMWMC